MRAGYLVITCSLLLSTIDAQDGIEKIKKGTAFDAYGTLNRYKISTFSTDKLIKDGIPQTELKEWQQVTNVANTYARQEDPKSSADVEKLESVLNFVVNTVRLLHDTYGKAFVSFDVKNKQWSIDLNKVEEPDISLLQDVKAKAKARLDAMSEMINQVLDIISKSTDYPESWTKQVPKKLDEIYPQYEELYADWSVAQKRTNYEMSDKEFNLFIRQHGIKDKEDAAEFLPILEKLQYRLDQKSGNIFGRKEKKMLPAFQQMAKRLKKVYPGMQLTILESNKIAATTDKLSMILLGQAEAMEGVLKRLIFETDALINALQK